MTKVKGTNIASGIVPYDSNDLYATHYAKYGKGGWHSVDTTSDRDAIPSDRLEPYMACLVKADKKLYILDENGNWYDYLYDTESEIAKEIQDRINADDALGVRIDNVINGTTDITYDNTVSGLDAITIKSAIDEVQSNVEAEELRASTVEGSLSDLTTDAKTNLVSAINEVDSHTDTNTSNIGTMSNLTTTEKSTLVGAINELDSDVGNRTNLTTDAKSNLVSAINEVDSHTDTNTSNIGTMSSLTTTEKSTLVGAINELDSDVGNKSSLTTDAKSNLVAAINEVDSHADTNTSNIGTMENLTTTEKSTLVGSINELDSDVGDKSTLTTDAKTNLVAAINEVDSHSDNNASHISTIESKIPSAATSSNKLTDKAYVDSIDESLQQQIDAITASSDVTDIVGTYAELQAYDTSKLGNNDIIKVLQDETENDATTYYRWSTSTQQFTLIGEEGPYYTIASADSTFATITSLNDEISRAEGVEGTLSNLTTTDKTNLVSAINELDNVKAEDDLVVHKAGTETITGPKTFTQSVSLNTSSSEIDIHTKNTNLDLTDTTRPSNLHTYFRQLDKNNVIGGEVGFVNTTDGSVTAILQARNSSSGSQVISYVRALVDKNGNAKVNTIDPIEDTTTSVQVDTVGSRNRKIQKMITNCITEIPQDIKLELNNGTLTLKAGSKIYVPNGAGVFDTVTIESDKTVTYSSNGKRYVYINLTNENLVVGPTMSETCSGSTDALSGTAWHMWFDTTNNIINRYAGDGTTVVSACSLPIAITTVSNGAISSIDQVFNGFGYIGSTIFALPGVKGLIPNGRNDDGTLKSTLAILTSVQTTTNNNGNGDFSVRIGNNYIAVGVFPYDEETNFNYNQYISPSNIRYQFNAGAVEYSSGKIISLTPKTAFHAVDYNDFLDLKDTVDINDENAVHKTGNETINGVKTFNDQIERSGSFSSGTSAVVLRDSNNKGYISYKAHYLNNNVHARVYNVNSVSSKEAYIEVIHKDTGEFYGNLSGTGTNTSQTKVTNSTSDTTIPTMGWVNNPDKSTNVVHRSGNETINGGKIFNNDIKVGTAADNSANGTLISNSGTIELYGGGYGGIIDFHKPNSHTTDFTSRLYEQSSGYLAIDKAPSEDTTSSTQIDTVGARNTKLQGYANNSLSNLSADGQMIIDSQNGAISNCILEIPQNIKISISNNVITLASGSVVALTGYNTYTTRTTSSDITKDGWGSQWYGKKVLMFIGATGTWFGYKEVSKVGSGSSLPADNTNFDNFYLTSDYSLYEWSDNTWKTIAYSYPLCIIDIDSSGNGAFAKDSNGNDMIFNGAGFIGDAIFVYPNVKGLIPNGFNEDGSLKSTEFTTSSLSIITSLGSYTSHRYVATNGGSNNVSPTLNYIKEANRNSTGLGYWNYISIAEFDLDINTTPKINKFTIRQPVRLVTTEMLDNYSTTDEVNSALALKQDITTAVNYDNITNCITEIPQDIKLELNNGTLTLKAGSKIYVPNGFDGTTPKFDVVTIASDKTGQQSANGQITVYYNTSQNKISSFYSSADMSGTTAPTTYGTWYDTTNNLIKRYDSGSLTVSGLSLPLARVTVSNGAISSIDQVFNGFGYIGSTVFALPGVKGLIPNGRNDDGSLKNTEFALTSVSIRTESSYNANTDLAFSPAGGIAINIFSYNTRENLMHDKNGNATSRCVFGKIVFNSSSPYNVISFTPKTAFHAVDYNDFAPVKEQVDTNTTTITTKQDTLVSGTNIKTINNASILGSGNLTTSAQWGGVTGTLSDQTDLQTALDTQNGTISNCILEIPQNIKLTLENNVLTLKSGSVITLCGSTYSTVTTSADLTVTISTNDTWAVFPRNNGGSIGNYVRLDRIGSGSSLPADDINYQCFFNTTDKKIYLYSNGAWAEWNVGYPICVIKVENGNMSFLKDSNGNDMIFNGTGFIGQTKFLLPGVKVLQPIGYNSDGTLKSREFTNNSLQLVTQGGTYNRKMYLNGDVFQITTNPWYYDENTNFWYNQDNNPFVNGCVCLGDCYTVNDIVTDFTIYQPVRLATTEMLDRVQSQVDTKANDADVVKLTGNQTIYDTKTFSSAIQRTASLSSGSSTLIQLNDNNGKGNVKQEAFYTNNALYNRLTASNTTAGKYGYIEIQVNDNGDLYGNIIGNGNNLSLNQASSSITSTRIPTEGWVNNPATSTNVVHRTGNETITDVKTFTDNVNANTSVTIGQHSVVSYNSTTEALEFNFI